MAGTLWMIGMMGSGKTTVGEIVADLMALPFIDLDTVIESDAGMTVAAIFYAEGEAGFRRRESVALAGVAGTECVVACGGGAVLSRPNRDVMTASGTVVWLQAPVATLAARVGDGSGRPLVSGDVAAGLQAILGERRDAYDDAASVAVDGDRPPRTVAEEVVAWLRRS